MYMRNKVNATYSPIAFKNVNMGKDWLRSTGLYSFSEFRLLLFLFLSLSDPEQG